MARRQGFSLVEILIAVAIGLPIMVSALRLASSALDELGRRRSLLNGTVTLSRLMAFLEPAVYNGGLGLPPIWPAGLFRVQGTAQPRWATWGRWLTVGHRDGGVFVPLPPGQEGDALRLATAIRVEGAVVLRAVEAQSRRTFDLRYLGRLPTEGTGVRRPANWLILPGLDWPVHLGRRQTGGLNEALTAGDLSIPFAQPIYRLVAVELWQSGTTVYGDFQDDSGGQPLFRNVDLCRFRENGGNLEISARAGGVWRQRLWRVAP